MLLWRLYEFLYVNSQAQFLLHNRQTIQLISASLLSSVLLIPTQHSSGFYLYVRPTQTRAYTHTYTHARAHTHRFCLFHVHGWFLSLISLMSIDWKAQSSLSTSFPTLDSEMYADGVGVAWNQTPP